ncbi:MAG: tetratricopeptide repeat protein [Candidatus Obscuribacterales bacterium]|nr:tetratricopeptide repeat protein [Candidatus Obscuribacterales bacterium]
MKSFKRWSPVLLVPGCWITLILSLGVLAYSGFRFLQFDLPMLQNRYSDAMNNEVWINSPEAIYNQGLSEYEQHDYDTSAKLMLKVYAACCDANGQVLESKRKLAALAQSYIGNSYFNLGKNDDAIAAYEESLRLVQGDLITIYNLEKLQDAKKSSGESGGNKGEKPGQGKKKI